MGREERMSCTQFVPCWICWLCYLSAFAVVGVTFVVLEEASYFTGWLAHTLSTVCIFGFSLACSNSSLYDPAWVALPVALGVAYMATAPSISFRGGYTLALMISWWCRYQWWFPWDGWHKGLDAEDWRYVQVAKTTGEGTLLYWIMSLVSFHLTPTFLVWLGLAPVIPVWTTADQPGLGLWDLLAITVTITALSIQAISDEQLRRFREKQYGTKANLNTCTSSKAILRDGLWAYSRHPNYFGEALFWLGMACIGAAGRSSEERFWVSTSNNLRNAASVSFCWGGALLMFGFFYVSAHLTDQRMLKHRGDPYQQVMNEVSALVPFPFGGRSRKPTSD